MITMRTFIITLLLIASGHFAAHADDGPKRILTLGSDITEIVYSLGEGARVVGRDSTSVYPPEAGTLPDVGYFRQLGAEGLLSLKPDLIIASASAGPPEVLQQIASTGVKILSMPEKMSSDGLIEKVGEIARAIGAEAKGAELAANLKRDIESARAEIARLPGKPKVLFIISSGGGAPQAAGRVTAADAMIALAGGENVFAAHEGYKPISLEAAAAAGPDAIAMMEHTLKAMGGVDGVAANPALNLTPAAKSKRVVARNGSYLLSFGPRLPTAMLDFAHAIRGKEQS
jgi:iron complex transport system substrate-binding protein